MIYFCCDDEPRRDLVRNSNQFNGIDFLEVADDPADPLEKRQRTLFVHFLNTVVLNTLQEKNVRIDGGERIEDIEVVRVSRPAFASPPSSPPVAANIVAVEVSARGDFSTYTLRLVTNSGDDTPPPGFDPILSTIDFSFKVACPTDFDCRPQRACPTEPLPDAQIDYLAKDYASFRQLILDRLALLAPQWKERSVADLGIVLVELLAYIGDYLSYQQDAVATESYLGTARLRSSIRRHARLIDYPMHDGRNARAWVHIEVNDSGDGLTLTRGAGRTTTKLITNTGLFPDRTIISQPSHQLDEVMALRPQVFELMHDVALHKAHNEIKFYTWGATDCCLAKGSTSAVLEGQLPSLQVGDVLLLVEKRGARTGVESDADPSHRHAVRLTKVTPATDAIGGQLKSPAENSIPVTEIKWDIADALPFPLCISSRVGTTSFGDVGVAYGNIVLVDHGMTFTDQPEQPPLDPAEIVTSLSPDTVPPANAVLNRVTSSATSRCDDPTVEQLPARYRPRVLRAPLTQAPGYDATKPAALAIGRDLSIANPDEFPLPCIALNDPQIPDEDWQPARDLVSQKESDKSFVVEIETDGTAYLRFGDGISGSRPAEGVRFLATYRIGNGAPGNVGRDAIRYLVTSAAGFTGNEIARVSNPLAARAGIDSETIEEVRQNAPAAFRLQQRAVTPADYEQIAIRKDVVEHCGLDVQRAAATLRWTGSWHTMFVSADRFAGLPVDAKFENSLRQCLERFRMAGQDLEVDGPVLVPLEIELGVCVKPGYFFSDVEQALLEVFSDRILPDGRRGVFHPDNFTFGQPVYSSSLIAAAQCVAGVDSVVIKKLQRQRIDSDAARKAGKLELGRLEIAQLDNDPNFPERGSFTVTQG